MSFVKHASITVAVLMALAVAGPPAFAAPQGPWVQPAVDLSATGGSIDSPRITTAADGTTTAVWYRDDGNNDIIQAATRPPGGSFGGPLNLSVAGEDAVYPQIATAPDGTATVVWRRFNGSNKIIQAATRPPGGSFGTPVDLSGIGKDAKDPQISVAPDGTATAVWTRFNGSNDIIQAATRPPGGSFGTPIDLSVTGRSAAGPQITIGSDGTATAVWYRFTGFDLIVQAATRPPGGSFGIPVDLSVAGKNAVSPQIDTAPDGTSTAVWARWNGTNFILQAATRPPGESFGAPVDLSTIGENVDVPEVAVAADGTATAVWVRFDGANFIIQTAVRPPGGSFGAPINLSASGRDADLPRISTGPDSTTTVVWYRSNGTNEIVQAATRPPGGTFGATVDLSASGESASNASITIGPDGRATAIWRRDSGSDGIAQAISTAQPSFLLGVAKSGSGSGTVTSAAPGIDCGTDCAGVYPSFTKVTLTATPDSGSAFAGWKGACGTATGNTCELTLLDNRSVIADFGISPPSGNAMLRITKVKPGRAKVKRGKILKLRVTGKNVGESVATNAKLCLKVKVGVKKRLKPKGRTCQKLGTLGVGTARTRTFKLKATGRAKRGKTYKVKFRLSAKGAKTAIRVLKVRVR